MAEKPGCAKTGCGCVLLLAVGSAALLLLLSYAATEIPNAPVVKGPATQWITYVGEKGYDGDDEQTLVVYAMNGAKWDQAEYEKLCSFEDARNKGTFRVVAIFNKSQNATYSQFPPSAAYSADPELTSVAPNIVAMHTHNARNGYRDSTGYKPKGIFQ